MDTYYAPMAVDLFLFCYERDFSCPFLVISRLILLRLFTLYLDIWIIFETLIIFILKIW